MTARELFIQVIFSQRFNLLGVLFGFWASLDELVIWSSYQGTLLIKNKCTKCFADRSFMFYLLERKRSCQLINFSVHKGISQASECGGLKERLQNQLINKYWGGFLECLGKVRFYWIQTGLPSVPSMLLSPFRMRAIGWLILEYFVLAAKIVELHLFKHSLCTKMKKSDFPLISLVSFVLLQHGIKYERKSMEFWIKSKTKTEGFRLALYSLVSWVW